MNIFKLAILSSVISLFLMGLTSKAEARCHFGFNVNLGGPSYVVAPPPPPVVVAPAYPVYGAPVYTYPAYPCYAAPVVVQRPAVVVRPGVSYTYWRR